MAEELFEPAGVDIVLSGDAHFYWHLQKNGVRHMVLGSFGSSLYDVTTGPKVVYSEKTYNFGMIDMTPTSLMLKAYRSGNSPIETVALTNPVPEPSIPPRRLHWHGGCGSGDAAGSRRPPR